MSADGSEQRPSRENSPSTMAALGTFATIGFEFLAAILLPGALGWWLDGKFDSTPWLMIIGGTFGFAAGLYLMLRASRRSMK